MVDLLDENYSSNLTFKDWNMESDDMSSNIISEILDEETSNSDGRDGDKIDSNHASGEVGQNFIIDQAMSFFLRDEKLDR